MTEKKIAVIGGGFTGLACATQLAEKGMQVHLFERESFLGGLAAGFKKPEWEWNLEHFYHHWFKSDEYVQKFARKWNVEKSLFFTSPSTVMQTQNHGFVSLDSALALLRYPEIAFHNRVRMGISLAFLKATKSWKGLEHTTAEKWCVRTMGEQGFNSIWKPLLLGKFGQKYADQVNMAWLWARISCRTPQLGYCQGGFSGYIAAAERHLREQGVEIQHNCKNLSLQKTGAHWKVLGEGNGSLFDAVVVAASPLALDALLSRPAAPAKPFLGAHVIVLSVKKPLGKHYWYSLRKSKNQPFLALIEHTNFVDSKYYNGEHLIYLADYVDPQSEHWKRSDAELIEAAAISCALVRPDFSLSEVNQSWVFREAYAQPIPLVDESLKIPSVAVAGHENLFHASMGHVYPWDRGTNFALELGEKVANRVENCWIKK